MIYRFRDFELDTDRYELRARGSVRHVEPQVFDVLVYLIDHRERLVTRDELLAQVWGHSFVSDATVSSRLMAARKAIDDSGRAQKLIRTVRGRGYQFTGTVQEAAAPPAAPAATEGPSGGPTPIGRREELSQLSRLLGAAVGGTRQFALVTGEPGAGKTTLVEHFLAEANAGGPVVVASGRCLEQRGPAEPYMAVLEALGRLCRGAGGEHAKPVLTRFAPTWMSQMPGLLDEEELVAVRDRSVGARPERMLRELGEALEALGAVTPVVLVIDDLHWADSSTVELLAHTARRDDPARLLIVGATRPVTGGPLDDLRRELRGRGRCVELALPLLAADDVQSYLAECYPGAESLAALVHQRTDGNPLFMDCLLRSWVDVGVLDSQNGLWSVRNEERELAKDMPDTLRDLLDQDIERLAREDQRVLEVASAVGQEFSAAAVAAGLEHSTEEVEGRCTALARRRRFLRERGADRWLDGTVAAAFAFVHDLHREVLYGRLPAGRRATIHGEIGGRLESGYGAEAGEHAAELAVHFLEAHDPARATHYLGLAADKALERGAPGDALDDLTTALDLVRRSPGLPDSGRRELPLQGALARALLATEGWSSVSAEQAYGRGIELARELGDDRSTASLLYQLAGLHEFRGNYTESEALLDEALRIEGTEREAARLLEAHELMACSLFHQGSLEPAIDHAEQGLALSEPDWRHPDQAVHGEDPAVSCNDWAGLALWCLGHPDRALERIRAALELASAPGHEYGLANATMYAARLHHLRREPQEALLHAEAAVTLAAERGFPFQGAAGQVLRGWALTHLGRSEEQIEYMRQGLEAHRAAGAAMDRPYYLAVLAEALREAGRPEEALSTIDEAIELLGGDRAFFYEAELHRLHGSLGLELDRAGVTDAAAADFQRALEVARHQHARALELRAARSLAELFRERGAIADALEVLAGPCEWFEGQTATADLREARDLLSALREDSSRASRI